MSEDKDLVEKINLKYPDNSWEVIDILRENNHTYYLSKCKCGCGEITKIRGDNYVKNSHKCNEYILKSKENNSDSKRQINNDKKISEAKDRIGNVYGNLKVIDIEVKTTTNRIFYICECVCGKIIKANYNHLINKIKTDCGCISGKLSRVRLNEYDLTSEDYGIGYTLNTNMAFYFDKDKFDLIKEYGWCEHEGYITSRVRGDRKRDEVKLHRLVMGVTDKNIKVDHIHHNKNDNRCSELRLTTNQENCFNHVLHGNNTSGYSGITWNKENNKWRARIFVNKKGIQLGYFDNIEDAIAARKEAEIKYFGEYRYKGDDEVGA